MTGSQNTGVTLQCTLCAFAATLVLVPVARADLEISSNPPLQPLFSRSSEDYVTRCSGDEPISVSLDAAKSVKVSVDGARPTRGEATIPVELEHGQAFQIAVRGGGRRTRHHVRCLPPDFFSWTAERTGPTESQWYVLTPSIAFGQPASPYVAIFNPDGVPVWWIKQDPYAIDAKLLPNGHLAWAQTPGGFPFNFFPSLVYREHRLDGALVRTIRTNGSPTDFHELLLLDSGNYLLLTYRPRDGVDLSPWSGVEDATVLDAEIQEVTPAGATVWTWNSKDWLGLEEGERWYFQGVLGSGGTQLPDGRRAFDIVHPNSLEVERKTIVMSARHTDAVYGISRKTGEVQWKLGGSARPESLSVSGDTIGNELGGQHDARILPDGTLTIYDNGSARSRPPRAVRYEIDEADGTAKVLEEHTAPDVTSSLCCGSARRLPGGNWVVSWTSSPLVTEATAAGARRFTLLFEKTLFSYRVQPLLPGRLSAGELREGMDAMHPRASRARPRTSRSWR